MLTYVGQETRNGQAVQHVSVYQPASSDLDSGAAALWQHLTQIDLYLDATTSLPAALVFNAHPDNSTVTDIPIEIDFSNYQTVSGVELPFHVQKFLNNNLLLDLQLQTVNLNTGLTSSAFPVQ